MQKPQVILPPSDPELILAGLHTPQGAFDPYPFYAQLRDCAPVYRGPGTGGLWFLSKWADANAMLRSRAPILSGNPCFAKSPGMQRFADFIMFKDPPDHTKLRALAIQVFTPRLGERIQPFIETLVDRTLDGLAGFDRFEFIQDFAFKLPGAVIGHMFGVPPEDQKMVDGWIRTQAMGLGPGMREDLIAAIDQSTLSLQDYLRDLSRARCKAPGDDMLSQLLQASVDGERLDERELVALLNVLISAGTETTQNLLGAALYALLNAPEQMRLLRESTAFDRTCADEFIRFDGPALVSNVRFAFEDCEFSGVRIRTGEPVIALLAAANRDPAVFAAPNALDITRRPNPHLGFIAGIHACLGARLARAEIAVAIPRLVRRFPLLTLIEPPDYAIGAGAFRAMKAMHVAIG
jgi:cytochrome P450